MNAHYFCNCSRAYLVLAVVAITLSGSHGAIGAQDTEPDVHVIRPRIDVTAFDDLTTILTGPAALEAAEQIGPGSALIITIPGEGRFGCTANFVWEDGDKLYLGAAGHCFIPAATKATHGAGADYDPAGVEVRVCVNNCDANFRSMTLVGELVLLGKVAYARQSNATGEEQVGHDFGVVEIPAEFAPRVRRAMPVFGGPTRHLRLDPPHRRNHARRVS